MQRQTRSMQRSESIGRGKRSLDCSGGGGGDDEQPERKRPALASVIVEALKMDSLQKLCSSLEPVLRRVVSEEVERALAKLGPARISGRSSPKRIEGSDGRSLRLHFKSRLSLPLFTGGKVEGEQGAAIHIVLIDANTGHAVISGPESSAKLDVVVLEGDFNNEDDDDWTKEEFESNVVKERDGKRPLLTGELQVTLKEGVGTLGDLTFTDNSSWIRSRKFRLGLKVAPGYCEGVRVREAKTEAFTVKDHRGELYKKHYPPALNDEVWRLEKIGKDGAFHKKLNASGINTVKDFLLLAVRDSQKLRNILGSGMSNRMWESLMDHAKTCALSGKLYVYYPNDTRDVGVVFNNIYELHGLITGDQYLSPDQLCDSQKIYVDTLVKKAYENWNQVIDYDGKSLLGSKQIRRAIPSGNELPMGPISYSNALNSQLALPPLSVRVQPEQPLVVPSLPGAGYNGNLAAGYPNQPLMQNSNSHNQFESSSFTQHDLLNTPQQIQITSADRRMGLAPGPQQSFVSGFHNINPSIQQPNVNPDDDWSQNREKGAGEFFSEEEIRLRSNELLQDEDMQHEMLRILSMGGHASMNMFEDALSYPSYMASPAPNFSFGDDRSRSGKAVVGWLKIKAAMRWGFFIRKKAAERRAQLVEIDDE